MDRSSKNLLFNSNKQLCASKFVFKIFHNHSDFLNRCNFSEEMSVRKFSAENIRIGWEQPEYTIMVHSIFELIDRHNFLTSAHK
jgi:hypothetical protein